MTVDRAHGATFVVVFTACLVACVYMNLSCIVMLYAIVSIQQQQQLYNNDDGDDDDGGGGGDDDDDDDDDDLTHRLHVAASKGLVTILDVCLRHSSNTNARDVHGRVLSCCYQRHHKLF